MHRCSLQLTRVIANVSIHRQAGPALAADPAVMSFVKLLGAPPSIIYHVHASLHALPERKPVETHEELVLNLVRCAS